MEHKFKKFGGETIDDVGQYVQNMVKENKDLYVCVGCDSKQLRGTTLYVVAITIHSPLFRNGAHVIYTRIREKTKMKDDFARLWKEAEYLIDIGQLLHNKLQEIDYVRKTYDPIKGVLKIANDGFFKNVELHVDFNENSQHLSNRVYTAALPWLKGMGFKTLGKPYAFAASCAADLKCKV